MANNPILKAVNVIRSLPVPNAVQTRLSDLIFGSFVPFVGTSGLHYEELTPERVVVTIKNKRKVQNHIKGIHAAAMALLAETATGFVTGLNLPGDKLPLIKTMHVDYVRRSKGNMRAEAWINQEDLARMQSENKGSVEVNCTVTDESGKEPVKVTMTWAWVPKK